ncbi:hypothetical protein L7F22_028732 [Adiantum nelumboides]|nr:hypothetical protein [Adiantum nelumboides]
MILRWGVSPHLTSGQVRGAYWSSVASPPCLSLCAVVQLARSAFDITDCVLGFEGVFQGIAQVCPGGFKGIAGKGELCSGLRRDGGKAKILGREGMRGAYFTPPPKKSVRRAGRGAKQSPAMSAMRSRAGPTPVEEVKEVGGELLLAVSQPDVVPEPSSVKTAAVIGERKKKAGKGPNNDDVPPLAVVESEPCKLAAVTKEGKKEALKAQQNKATPLKIDAPLSTNVPREPCQGVASKKAPKAPKIATPLKIATPPGQDAPLSADIPREQGQSSVLKKAPKVPKEAQPTKHVRFVQGQDDPLSSDVPQEPCQDASLKKASAPKAPKEIQPTKQGLKIATPLKIAMPEGQDAPLSMHVPREQGQGANLKKAQRSQRRQNRYQTMASSRGCMWCDSQDHGHRDCDDFNEAYNKNIVFGKDNKIHLRATGEPIRVNFGQGGMKKLAEEILHNVTMVDAATYGLQVIFKADNDDAKAYGDLCAYALKMVERGKVSRGKLCEGNNVQVFVQNLQDIATPQGTITLEIADAQKWIDRVKTDLDDKAETFSQALVKKVLVAHFQDMDNDDDDDDDDDDDEVDDDDDEANDTEDQQGTSRHNQGLDDDDDN